MLKRLAPGIVVLCFIAAPLAAQQSNSMARFAQSPPDIQSVAQVTGALTTCSGGSAAGYACSNVDLLSVMPLSAFSSSAANDIWGWTDPLTSKEYALIGLNNGTGFVDVTDPVNPIYLGKLPTATSSSSWRDVKVYSNHAFIVSEASGHGVQIFDLTGLRSVASPPVTFSETAHYSGVADVHNIVINESTGFAYAVGNNGGGTTCSGGLHMINIQNPTSPAFAGCYSSDGYTHDAQCVTYTGPDTAHQGKEICIALNEDTITIVDVTTKSTPVQLSRRGYPGSAYVHQAWLSENQEILYQDDELDTGSTRTIIWDVSDLDDPIVANDYYAAYSSYDHNQYVVGDRLFQSNYTVGLRILDITNPTTPVEIGYFDTYTPSDGASFSGSWSNYPFFASGTVVVSSIGEGLFVLGPNLSPPSIDDVHVSNIVEGTQGGGRKIKGTATVTIKDNLGNAVQGAVVTGTFSGSFTETKTGTTGSDGSVTIVTSGRSTSSSFDFCVEDVESLYPYDSADNASSSYACDGGGGTDPPTSMHIASVSAGQTGGRQKSGSASVTIVDNYGNPVASASVTGTFSGDFSEPSGPESTGGNGVADFVTAGSKKGSVSVSFCVNAVSHASLTYAPGDDLDPGYACPPSQPAIDVLSKGDVPAGFELEQNYPNPFNPSTVISYSIPNAMNVSLKVFDALGREVANLTNGFREAGRHSVHFDATQLGAGNYIYTVSSGNWRLTRNLTILK